MSQQRGIVQLSLVGATILGLFVAVYLIVWKLFANSDADSPQPESAAPIKKHTVDTPADEVLKYWTKGRKRKAKPAKLPNVDADAIEPGRPSPHPPRPQQS